MKLTGIIFAVAFSGDIVGSLSLSLMDNNKHPLEDTKSWDLHVSRQLIVGDTTAGQDDVGSDINLRRQLETTETDGPPTAVGAAPTGNKTLFTVKHIVPKNHIPFAGGDTTHGMMIDAGSVRPRVQLSYLVLFLLSLLLIQRLYTHTQLFSSAFYLARI